MTTQAPSRTQRACKACRSLKVRCLPSDQEGVCQKCLKSGADCVFEEQKPRRKRDKPDSRARVTALERKLDEVIAQVSQSNRISQPNENPVNDENTPNISVDGSQRSQFGAASSKSIHDTSMGADGLPTPDSQTHDGQSGHTSDTAGKVRGSSCPITSVFVQFLSDGATPEMLISRGHLSILDVEHYIEVFRQMCSYFPFVIIPSGANVCALLKDRPLLLHAVLAVATSSEVCLQKVLEKSFKEIMLSRLVLEAEKSIDLLQSILICIAWGHFFHVPKRNQSYQILQMAIGLCIDLGLNMRPSLAIQKIGLHLDHSHPSGNPEEDNFWSREARRAFLGCYHVSTLNNWIWAKPNTLEYSDYILQCAQSISEVPEYFTDELILPLIQLQQIGDDYHKVLRVSGNEGYVSDQLDRIGTHTRFFQKQMQHLRDNLAPVAAGSTVITLSTHFTAVHSNEQDLLSPWATTSRLPPTSNTTNSIYHSTHCPSRIDILLNCLQAATSYLNLFLTIPQSTYSHLSTTQWSGLIYSLVIIYRLSIGTPHVPTWDVQTARDTVKLERYLEVLCERMQQATYHRLRAITDTNKRDMYSVMGLVLQNVRNTYERLRHLPQALSAMDAAPVHATSFPAAELADVSGHPPQPQSQPQPQPQPCRGPIFEHDQPRPGYQSRCPAMQFWNMPGSSGTNGMDTTGHDPFLDMGVNCGENGGDDDGFWNQMFTMEQAHWNLDLDVGVEFGMGGL